MVPWVCICCTIYYSILSQKASREAHFYVILVPFGCQQTYKCLSPLGAHAQQWGTKYKIMKIGVRLTVLHNLRLQTKKNFSSFGPLDYPSPLLKVALQASKTLTFLV